MPTVCLISACTEQITTRNVGYLETVSVGTRRLRLASQRMALESTALHDWLHSVCSVAGLGFVAAPYMDS